MSSNFSFLSTISDYTMFSGAAIEAERVYATSPAMCAVASRKALELAVKWVYAADNTMEMPYKDNLSSLIYENTFRFAVDPATWGKLPFVVKLGNLAVHTGKAIQYTDAVASLKGLFEFIEWVDYCYGSAYEERHFDETLLPKKDSEKQAAYKKSTAEYQNELSKKDSTIAELEKKIAAMSEQLTKAKTANKAKRSFHPDKASEFETRKRYIDLDMKSEGWVFDGNDVIEEYEIEDMLPGQKGYADYVLMGKDGFPLAVVEAKRTSKDPHVGQKQAQLYADGLERIYNRRPFIFLTNGFETFFWDDQSGAPRRVSGIFGREDLQRIMLRRKEAGDLSNISINDNITGRYYQKEAITAVCEHIKQGYRKNLLVMATGTGKTRTAASLVDVLSRAGHVTNVLFLADRTALVKQAKEAFQAHLESMSLCNLCSSKDDRNARVVFSTYPTILNAIDDAKSSDGLRLFTPAHFDLIIIDECHRSIFKKYKAIFDYFDSILVGLTATPKMEVDRNTYDFFEMESGVPTYAYDYETAVYQDHVLVPYYTYAVTTKFTEEGVKYSDLSQADRERLEEDYNAEGLDVPEFIPSMKLNKFLFNQKTVDTVLQDLMERGVKIDGGDKLGKTIIFAQNKEHAQYIVDRFNALYPWYHGTFAARVVCDDAYVQATIDDFKVPDKMPQIAVSVDMMDTGIDVPECVNLVFFKQVKSKTKFWQMIGRGTRLCPRITLIDKVEGEEYTDKKRFLIFDYCKNFEFFGMNGEGKEGKETRSLEETVFAKKVRIIGDLQSAAYIGNNYQNWRSDLVKACAGQVAALSYDLVSVRLKKEYVERYKDEKAYVNLSETAKRELVMQIAPLVVSMEKDSTAKRFDNFAYGLIVAGMERMKTYPHAIQQLKNICELLQRQVTIPQIKAKIDVIKAVQSDEFWQQDDLFYQVELARRDLRGLIQFLVGGGGKPRPIYTNIADPVIKEEEGVTVDKGYDFEDYKKKVNRYIGEHGNATAIYKLTHNKPLYQSDFDELQHIFTVELGKREDYEREYGDTPFGILVRKVAKLDHDAAMEAFSQFIGNEQLSQQQIQFVHKVITYIENNGYMEDLGDLTKAPFDRPVPFTKLFDFKTCTSIIEAINAVNDNATKVVVG